MVGGIIPQMTSVRQSQPLFWPKQKRYSTNPYHIWHASKATPPWSCSSPPCSPAPAPECAAWACRGPPWWRGCACPCRRRPRTWGERRCPFAWMKPARGGGAKKVSKEGHVDISRRKYTINSMTGFVWGWSRVFQSLLRFDRRAYERLVEEAATVTRGKSGLCLRNAKME